MNAKREKFNQAFQLAGGRESPPNCDSSFADVVYRHAEKRLELTDEGELIAIDHVGIKRYSRKDAKQVMTGLEGVEPRYGQKSAR